ncbi:hypothetical protein AMTR_s00057p00202350 [Amborella trichopoda]|uniref:Uncharacterized protein n=1 Tax=Amborella trichopoda TaxID=13333 RepID=U5CUI4_AMBTC|nr:hypothetical protein AMTR_s00057p00202350 [Amborella trichopoda]
MALVEPVVACRERLVINSFGQTVKSASRPDQTWVRTPLLELSGPNNLDRSTLDPADFGPSGPGRVCLVQVGSGLFGSYQGQPNPDPIRLRSALMGHHLPMKA